MVEFSVYLNSIGVFEQLTFLTISVIHVVCTVYLYRRYLEKREKLTWLFIAFFVVMAGFWFINFLIGTGILHLNLTVALEYTYLVGATILAVIGLVLLGFKHIYALPPLITVIAYIHQTQVDSKITEMSNIFQVLSLSFTGQFLGNPWYITLKAMFPNFLITGQQITTLLNLFFDPLARSPTIILGIWLALIIFPTTILFYILAWKNRSGRSLGFSLGLTTFIIIGFMTASLTTAPRDLYNVLTLIASGFFALGIFGVFDKLMKKETKKSR